MYFQVFGGGFLDKEVGFAHIWKFKYVESFQNVWKTYLKIVKGVKILRHFNRS